MPDVEEIVAGTTAIGTGGCCLILMVCFLVAVVAGTIALVRWAL